MRRTVWIAAAFSALSGCAAQDVITRCPALVEYPLADQRQAAQEMRVLLPSDSQVAKMIVDYGKLRDACRISEPPP